MNVHKAGLYASVLQSGSITFLNHRSWDQNWKETLPSQVVTWEARKIALCGSHLWLLSSVSRVPEDLSGGRGYSWVGTQWPPGKAELFPYFFLAAATLQAALAQPVLSRLSLSGLTMSVKTGARLGIPWVPGLRSGFLVWISKSSAHDDVGEVFQYMSALLHRATPPPWWAPSGHHVCWQSCCHLFELKSSGCR